MAITQALPTSTAITRRDGAALSREPASARLSVAIQPPTGQPEPGQRGHLQHTLVSAIRTLHYSRRTEQAYWHWTRAFVVWSGKRHPVDMGAAEIGQFLSHLATERDVSASTQRQALAALLFLYQKALQIELPYVDGIVRAKQPQRLPSVLTVDEVRRMFDQIPAASKRGLVARPLRSPAGLGFFPGLFPGSSHRKPPPARFHKLAPQHACESYFATPFVFSKLRSVPRPSMPPST